MVRRPKTLVADLGVATPANDDVAVGLATREGALHGPCVVSGIQSRHAEEIVFVRSGTVEVSDGEDQSSRYDPEREAQVTFKHLPEGSVISSPDNS